MQVSFHQNFWQNKNNFVTLQITNDEVYEYKGNDRHNR